MSIVGFNLFKDKIKKCQNNRLRIFCCENVSFLNQCFALSSIDESGFKYVFLSLAFNWDFEPGKVVRLLIS
jgi:hypothetical protein